MNTLYADIGVNQGFLPWLLSLHLTLPLWLIITLVLTFYVYHRQQRIKRSEKAGLQRIKDLENELYDIYTNGTILNIMKTRHVNIYREFRRRSEEIRRNQLGL